jgi:hypothetical protein
MARDSWWTKPWPSTVTVPPSTSPPAGVTVTLGGGSSGAPAAKAIGAATVEVPPSTPTPAASTHPGAIRQSTGPAQSFVNTKT